MWARGPRRSAFTAWPGREAMSGDNRSPGENQTLQNMKSNRSLPAAIRPQSMGARIKSCVLRKLLPLGLLLSLPTAVQARFIYTTNNGQITITGYDCSEGAVTKKASVLGIDNLSSLFKYSGQLLHWYIRSASSARSQQCAFSIPLETPPGTQPLKLEECDRAFRN